MKISNTDERYGVIAQILHWFVVLLVFIQYIIGSIAADLPLGMQRLVLLARHKSVGITIFIIIILRIIWRLINKIPSLPANMPSYQRRLSCITHWSLYLILLCMPIAGWINSSASNITVSWFGIFTLPDLVGPDKHIATIAKETHHILGWILFAVIGLHIFAALYHHFILKDNVLMRMLPQFRSTQEN